MAETPTQDTDAEVDRESTADPQRKGKGKTSADRSRGEGAATGKSREWWQERNRLGVRNWELTFILVAAVIAGIVVTIGTSLLGVR